MRKILFVLCISISLFGKAQTYTLQDIANSIKTFGTHMLYLEGPRLLIGSYDTVLIDKSYLRAVLQGELWAAGSRTGSLYQVISFDARDISNDVTIVPYRDENGGTNRWDVVLKAKNSLSLIHFRNEQLGSNGVHFIRLHQDVSTISFMFISEDAANRFKRIAKLVFK